MLVLIGSVVALGQQRPANMAGYPAARTTAPDGVTKPVQASQPINPGQAIYLVRSALMMLNDANRSGNYSVLRDLAAPDFQARNSAADLAQSFDDLRRRKFDLFAAALLTPQFTKPPALDANGLLQLVGFFPTSPLRIRFIMSFQTVSGEWRLLALSVNTPPAKTAQSQKGQGIPRHGPVPFYGFRGLSGTAGWRW
jgi:hypothetical protein